jgi:hypothetical protein
MSRRPCLKHQISRLRVALGMDQKTFAAALCLKIKTLQSYEACANRLPGCVAEEVGKLFNVDADALAANTGLLTPEKLPWSPKDASKFSLEFQIVWAKINALHGTTALSAIYAAAAQKQLVPLLSRKVIVFFSKLEEEFGLDQKTYNSYKKENDLKIEGLEAQLDEIQMTDFKKSALCNKMDQGGVFHIATDTGQEVMLNLPADLMKRASAKPGEKIELPSDYWPKKKGALLSQRPKQRRAKPKKRS